MFRPPKGTSLSGTTRFEPILVDFGISQVVTEPTRNINILDVFITDRPDLFNCYVAKSAVYVNCTDADNSTKNCATATAASRKQYKRYKVV